TSIDSSSFCDRTSPFSIASASSFLSIGGFTSGLGGIPYTGAGSLAAALDGMDDEGGLGASLATAGAAGAAGGEAGTDGLDTLVFCFLLVQKTRRVRRRKKKEE
ncbi:hypothetical protein PFISCL1PPCAC_6564, partial [Pristionchus fissidentatus]